jgi:hypothetical protein
MSVRGVLRRLEKVKADRAARRLDAFNRYCEKYGEEPAVSAAIDVVCDRMTEAEAGLGYKVTAREVLDEQWMARHGLTDAMNQVFRAVQDLEAGAAGQGDARGLGLTERPRSAAGSRERNR